MLQCPSCSSEAPPRSRFCPSCGGSLGDAPSGTPASPPNGVDDADATEFVAPQATRPSDPRDGERFVPGSILVGRYRIISLLGRGGMGEVYRADDLKLGQSVALKFLPAAVQQDPTRLARLLDEVRLARQVSHPNVCRVYDIGEVDGNHFLSMEFVDGEDLASLLRRIGRLPSDKAVQIARELCAGLDAAHQEGILHRDLKPANVMIDSRGRARVTDFGLAGLIDGFDATEVRSGTPAYMAPEQLEGREVTVQSDLYALGLVLYEVFTGKAAFAATSVQESLRMRHESTPTNPTSLVSGMDPAAEAVILRCLEKDAPQRPASAVAVAAALPGGDPLAAALAAGETPSPELVAEAGGRGHLRAPVAWALLVVVLFGGLLAQVVRNRLAPDVPREKSPDVLTERARELLREFGHVDPFVDSARGFALNNEYLDHIAATDSVEALADLVQRQPSILRFWYRQSPRPMVRNVSFYEFRLTEDQPALDVPGMASVQLDPTGRLLGLQAVPARFVDAGSTTTSVDWRALFDAAGLDMDGMMPADPQWTPPVHADARKAWNRDSGTSNHGPVRVEAAAFQGKPVYFEIVWPWTTLPADETVAQGVLNRVTQYVQLAVVVAAFVAGLWMARRNIRLGRGDRSGARRFAVFLVAGYVVMWVLMADHSTEASELTGFLGNLSFGFTVAAFGYVLYVALEPFLRRLWPGMLVTWMRLLAGRFRDPRLGRDVLIGATTAIVYQVFLLTWFSSSRWSGIRHTSFPLYEWNPDLIPVGLRHSLGELALALYAAPLGTLLTVVLLLLLYLVVRRRSVAVIVWLLVLAIFDNVWSSHPAWDFAMNLGWWSAGAFALLRFGLVAFVSSFMFQNLLLNFRPVTDTSAWYAGPSALGMIAFVALTVYAFRLALPTQPAASEPSSP